MDCDGGTKMRIGVWIFKIAPMGQTTDVKCLKNGRVLSKKVFDQDCFESLETFTKSNDGRKESSLLVRRKMISE
jgi:hypothetical protein